MDDPVIEVTTKIVCRDLPPGLAVQIKARLTVANPKWLENERLGYWNGDTQREIKGYARKNGVLLVPRGFMRQLLSLCRQHGVTPNIIDNRRILPQVKFEFAGNLRPFQEEAVTDVLARDFGTLSAPTGSGKTVVALYIVAKRGQPVLIVVHTKELLFQWIERIVTFLGTPKEEIGIIGAGKKTIGSRITVALVQSLYKCADEVAPYIGHLVVDECHRTPSRTFTEAVAVFDSRFMLGLSATPWRRDGLSKLIFWHVGDVTHEVKKPDLVATGDVLPADVIVRETDFQTSFDPSEEYTKMLSELTEDPGRNLLIAEDVIQQARNGAGICLVLSDRKAHCLELQHLIESLPGGLNAELLTGDLSANARRDVVERLNDGGVKVLVATGQLIGEGFDCRELSTLFLATPIKFNGRLIQYLGRVLRPAPGKEKARVFDYVDSQVGVLKAAFRNRRRIYANG